MQIFRIFKWENADGNIFWMQTKLAKDQQTRIIKILITHYHLFALHLKINTNQPKWKVINHIPFNKLTDCNKFAIKPDLIVESIQRPHKNPQKLCNNKIIFITSFRFIPISIFFVFIMESHDGCCWKKKLIPKRPSISWSFLK